MIETMKCSQTLNRKSLQMDTEIVMFNGERNSFVHLLLAVSYDPNGKAHMETSVGSVHIREASAGRTTVMVLCIIYVLASLYQELRELFNHGPARYCSDGDNVL